MPLYLSKFSYTPETVQADRQPRGPTRGRSVVHRVGRWAAPRILVRLRHARRLHPLGGSRQRVHGRGRLALSGGGAISSLETTVLLTVDETIDALRKADQVKYRPPGT